VGVAYWPRALHRPRSDGDRLRGRARKVAGIGYKEIEPAGGYGNLSPKEFRALLDRLGLSMPSTHSGASGAGLELEKQLEGFQTMGIKYTTISGGGAAAPVARAG
jgi:hypothetical protein